jgi:hypothetical protein
MKKTIEYINMETGEIETVEETIPNALPTRICNKADSAYKATVKQNQDPELNNAFEGMGKSKEIVMNYLLDRWINADIDLDQIRGKSTNEIVGEYEEDLYGISSKKKES